MMNKTHIPYYPLDIDFDYLANSHEFAEFSHLLGELAGIVMTLRDTTGVRTHAVFSPKMESPLCQLIASTPEGYKRCRACDHKHFDQALEHGRPLQYHCHAGLIDLAIPITVGGKHIATISSGQLLPAAPNKKDAEKFVKRLAGLKLPAHKLRKAYAQAPYLEKPQLDSVLQMLSFFAKYLCQVRLTMREVITRLQRPEVTAAQQFIEEHLAKTITLNQVAQHVKLSAVHLSALFHKETGNTFTEYIQMRRIHRAVQLLSSDQLSITDISFACGFNNLTHFNRVFRKFHKCSPTDHRKNLKSLTFR